MLPMSIGVAELSDYSRTGAGRFYGLFPPEVTN